MFTSYRTNVEAETVAAHPYAPPLQHVVTLGPDEGRVRLRARFVETDQGLGLGQRRGRGAHPLQHQVTVARRTIACE